MATQNTFDYIPDEPVKKEQKPKIQKEGAIDPSLKTSKHKSAGLQTPKANAPDVTGDAGSTPAEVKIEAAATESVQEILPPGEVGTIVALIEEAKSNNLVVALSSEKGLDPLLEKIRERVRSEKFDVTSEKGRKRIGSVAREIGETKMDLKRMGLELTEGWRKSTKAVTSEMSRVETEMDALRDEILAPRIEFENREKNRVDGHKQRLEQLAALALFPDPDYAPTSAAIQNRINRLSDFNDIDWQEFVEIAEVSREKVEAQLSTMLVTLKKAEDDAAELALFRQKQEEENARAQKTYDEAHIDNVAFDAAAKAKKDAEEEAERQRVAREAEVKKEQDALQAQKDESDAKVAKAEEDRIAAHKQAIKTINDLGVVPEGASSAAIHSRIDTLEVIYKRDWQEFHEEAADKFNVTRNNLVGDHTLAVDKEAVEKAKADKKALDDALKLAKDNEAAAKKVIDDATAKRNADTAHKAKINNAAVAALAGVIGAETQQLCEEFAKEVVIAIASGKIPNVTITY